MKCFPGKQSGLSSERMQATELTSWSSEMTLSSASCECEASAACFAVASSESEMVDDGGCSKLAGMLTTKVFTVCLRPACDLTARVNSPTLGLNELSVARFHLFVARR